MSLDAEIESASRRRGHGVIDGDAGARQASIIPLGLARTARRRGLRAWLAGALGYGRVQLCLGLVFSVAATAAAHWAHSLVRDVSPFDEASLVTLLGASVTMVLGFLALRQIRSFPGVNSAAYVVWVFTGAYAAFLTTLVFGRIEYSRYQLLVCSALTVAWFLLIHYAVVRNRPMRLAVVPSPGVETLPQMKYVAWMPLREPRLIHIADGVVADLREDHPPQWRAFLTRCALQGLPIFDVKQVTESLTGRVNIERLSENTLAYRVHTAVYRKFKRVIDTAAALALSPVILLVLGIAGAAVKLTSPGPVLFCQMRMGHRGRRFKILKLRTMVHGGGPGERFTGEDDPRVTTVGRFLRKYRIDELPQAWNIVRGEMSWIGPRPEAVELAQAYEQAAPFYSYRHIVRPGISGWAQVNQGNVAGADDARIKLQYDFFYLKNLSPWLDLVIVVKTIQTVLTGFGAR
ncbi:MAG TPA: sugar transferase [Caulobacteraceae bacterium]